jgi:OmpA-OmpF porin, OOP family
MFRLEKKLPKIFQVLLITLLLLSFEGNGMAAAPGKVTQQRPTFSLTPSLGGFVYNPSGGTQVGPVLGLKASYEIIGASIVDSLGMEGTFNYFSTLGGKSTSGAMLRADVTYLITPKTDIVPLIAVGLGDLLVNGGGPASSLLVNYGAGLKYFFEDWLAWRFDVRHIMVYRNINMENNFELTAGLTYVFGKEHKKRKKKRGTTAPVPLLPVPAIPNIGDTEPGAPVSGTTGKFDYSIMEKLDIIGPSIYGIGPTPPAFHEPVPPTPPTPRPKAYKPLPGEGPPQETPAPRDVQPPAPGETPEPAPQPEGRSLPRSNAPSEAALPPAGTAPATRVELLTVSQTPAAASRNDSAQEKRNPAATPTPKATGPAESVLCDVYFDFDSHAVSVAAREKLATVAEHLKKNPTASFRIEGHCDAVGSDDYNFGLGERRAKAAVRYLLKLGVPAQRLSTISYGKERPASTGHEAIARARNRRVEVIVIR